MSINHSYSLWKRTTYKGCPTLFASRPEHLAELSVKISCSSWDSLVKDLLVNVDLLLLHVLIWFMSCIYKSFLWINLWFKRKIRSLTNLLFCITLNPWWGNHACWFIDFSYLQCVYGYATIVQADVKSHVKGVWDFRMITRTLLFFLVLNNLV